MKKIAVLFLLIFISMNSVHPTIHYHKIENKDSVEDTTSVDTSFLKGELNDSTLLLALKHYKVRDPEIVRAQARLESGFYKSKLCRKHNNFLGLYNSRKRQYFRFKHWTHCITAYKKYIEYRKKKGENHYVFIKRIRYSSNPHYVKHVKRLVQHRR